MSEFLIYQAEDGKTQLSVLLDNEDLWLSQKQLTELFGKAKGTISEHIKHIFEDGELHEASVVRFYRTTATDGKSYEVAHYNLEMVLALGLAGFVAALAGLLSMASRRQTTSIKGV